MVIGLPNAILRFSNLTIQIFKSATRKSGIRETERKGRGGVGFYIVFDVGFIVNNGYSIDWIIWFFFDASP